MTYKLKAVKFISDFEQTASDLAIENHYDYVVCGHIHEPIITIKENKKGSVTYLNSGDWIENLTALEYHRKRWKLYRHSHEIQVIEEDYFEMEDQLGHQLIATLLFNNK